MARLLTRNGNLICRLEAHARTRRDPECYYASCMCPTGKGEGSGFSQALIDNEHPVRHAWTIENRHLDVEKDEVGEPLIETLQTILSVVRDSNVVADRGLHLDLTARWTRRLSTAAAAARAGGE